MKTRVAMLTHDEANAEKRPFRVVGTVSGPQNGYVSVEYLDVYEYTSVWSPSALAVHLANGWGVENTAMDSDGDWSYLLRRVTPESEAYDGKDN